MSSPTFRPIPAGSGTGDMTKAVYDTDDSGVVDDSTLWDGQALPSIADATGGQVLALKSDKSALEFATVDLDTLGAASSTTAAQTIYVDAAATGAGTGVDWTNAFTTIQAAVNSLPAIINNVVTIYVRKGATPYRETVTIKRVIAGGSIALRGEYYWDNQAASNSTENTIVKAAADDFNAVEVGDAVYLLEYSGTFDASAPANTYVGTVSDVTNKASGSIVVDVDATVTPTVGWKYIICKTEISGSDDGSTATRPGCIFVNCPMQIYGLKCTLTTANVIYINAVGNVSISACIIQTGGLVGVSSTGADLSVSSCAIDVTGTCIPLQAFSCLNGALSSTRLSGVAQWTSFVPIFRCCINSYFYAICNHINALSGSSGGCGILSFLGSNIYLAYTRVNGAGSDDKLGTGLAAVGSGSCIMEIGGNVIDATTVTTAKSPANWAATTDGAYIG